MDYILIIPGGLQIGGAEKVAANISKYAPNGEFCFHYIVFEGNDNVYGPEIEQKGGKVFTIPSPGKGYRQYIDFLGRLMDTYKYKAIHSHTMFNSGINLTVAKLHGIPIRICHSHTTKTETEVSKKQKIYETLMRWLIKRNATHFFACGKDAGYWLYGKKLFDKKGKIIFNGIDVEENMYNDENRNTFREQNGLNDKFVIGHVGQLFPVKNQAFLIEIMPDILSIIPNAVLVSVGYGDQTKLMQFAKKTGIQDNVLFYGPSFEVYKILSAFDVFVFPSLREGTPLALLEAQANGLPCIISENIPKDAVLTDLVDVVPLTEKQEWVSKICMSHRCENPKRYVDVMNDTGYSVKTAYLPIYEVYRSEL